MSSGLVCLYYTCSHLTTSTDSQVYHMNDFYINRNLLNNESDWYWIAAELGNCYIRNREWLGSAKLKDVIREKYMIWLIDTSAYPDHLHLQTLTSGSRILKYAARQIVGALPRWPSYFPPCWKEKLSILLWLELIAEEQRRYDTAKESLIMKMTPAGFISLDEFDQRKLLPGEALPVYLPIITSSNA